jgi:hypothetical protein
MLVYCFPLYSCQKSSITHLSSKSCKRSDHNWVLSSFQLDVSQSKFHTKALLKTFSEAHAPQAQQLHVPAPHQQTIHHSLYSHSCNQAQDPFLKHFCYQYPKFFQLYRQLGLCYSMVLTSSCHLSRLLCQVYYKLQVINNPSTLP